MHVAHSEHMTPHLISCCFQLLRPSAKYANDGRRAGQNDEALAGAGFAGDDGDDVGDVVVLVCMCVIRVLNRGSGSLIVSPSSGEVNKHALLKGRFTLVTPSVFICKTSRRILDLDSEKKETLKICTHLLQVIAIFLGLFLY